MILKISFFEKNQGMKRLIQSLEKNLVCDMETCYKKVSKIRNVIFILQKFENKFKKFIWILKKKDRLPDYLLDDYYFC